MEIRNTARVLHTMRSSMGQLFGVGHQIKGKKLQVYKRDRWHSPISLELTASKTKIYSKKKERRAMKLLLVMRKDESSVGLDI